MKDNFFTLKVCKQTLGKILQMKDNFFTLKVCKQTDGKTLESINDMQINKWGNFIDKQHLIYMPLVCLYTIDFKKNVVHL